MCSGDDCPRKRAFPPEPPEKRQIWLDSVLAEIAAKPSVQSRGTTYPRGIKQKTSHRNLQSRRCERDRRLAVRVKENRSARVDD